VLAWTFEGRRSGSAAEDTRRFGLPHYFRNFDWGFHRRVLLSGGDVDWEAATVEDTSTPTVAPASDHREVQ
jgi:hypothetical protein